MNERKSSAVCGTGVLALVPGFGLGAHPVPVPAAPSITRLGSPILDEAGDFGQNHRQGRPDQDRENRRRDDNR